MASVSSSARAEVVATAKSLLLKCQQAVSVEDLLSSLEAFFLLLKRESQGKGDLRFLLRSTSAGGAERRAGQNDKFTLWLLQAFEQFQKILDNLLTRGDADRRADAEDDSDELQAVALRFYMRLLLHEHSLALAHAGSVSRCEKITFPLASFQLLVSHVLHTPRFSPRLCDAFLKDYLCRYTDLRYNFLLAARKILSAQSFRKKSAADAAAENPDSAADASDEACGAREGDSEDDEAAECQAGTATRDKASGDAWYVWKQGSLEELGRRLYPLLVRLPAPEKRKEKQRSAASPSPSAAADADHLDFPDDDADMLATLSRQAAPSAPACVCFLSNVKTAKSGDPSAYRALYQEVWLSYLRNLPRDAAMTQSILHAVPKVLLPYMSNPLLLSDFFLDSFHTKDATKPVAVLALSGLFFLLAKHRLGDPDALFSSASPSEADRRPDAADESLEAAPGAPSSQRVCFHFYQRLYQLVTPASFAVCKNARFLRLLSCALRSSLLPNSLVAAFIKKCARVACLVAPASALYLVALVCSLLKKHSSVCISLLDVHPRLAAQLVVDGDAFDFDNLSLRDCANSASCGIRQRADAAAAPAEEAKDAQDADPMAALLRRCLPRHLALDKKGVLSCVKHQAQMSLWELDFLKAHFFHAVRQLSCMMECDPTKKSAGKESAIDIEDYLHLNLRTLLGRELKAAAKAKTVSTVFKTDERREEDIENLANVAVACARKRRKLK
ncbi:CBF/Mak21 family protein [Besnoitia besnoiti]|uniref:CBF/Mak21 family protein n=1 Tax=Besnoitia besnoiti TaxID=94643 RepID=A0A2A9MKS5_BESBE|nr:CBF/Mak21 family protein [Besnoitia besnoiti]PFH36227.1 CBF/Mak21 family protein [Besnoitia besnoiti]